MQGHEDDLYATLQVHPSADPVVIQAAYRQLAQRYLPYHNHSPEAALTMQRLNAAYETLSDPRKRAEYDRTRPASSGYGVPPRPPATRPTVDYSELKRELPPLPPVVTERGVEVTARMYIAWDVVGARVMPPWGVTAVAFLRGGDGGFTVWTPGYSLGVWLWRGPVGFAKDIADLLASWLSQAENSKRNTREAGARGIQHTAAKDSTFQAWDPDPEMEAGFWLRRDIDGEFEVFVGWAGLGRGSAKIGREDADLLARWLISPQARLEPGVQ